MPKTKLGERFSSQNETPVDWLWAAVLEQKAVKRMGLKELAKIADVSYETMRQYIRKSPWEWPRSAREKVCKAFGLVIKVEHEGFQMEVKE